MSFQTAAYLRKATLRAKSDVANKLVSMFLHGVSRKISAALEVKVTDIRYTDSVVARFGVTCCYCSKLLEDDRASVEHPDGMNRFRSGLHIPGNVILACKRCNNEKRRDDQLLELKLADSGWASFLAHDSSRCDSGCKTCAYWKTVWPDHRERCKNLKIASARIVEFRAEYKQAIQISQIAQPFLHKEVEKIYRECQMFATDCIKGSVDNVIASLPNKQNG